MRLAIRKRPALMLFITITSLAICGLLVLQGSAPTLSAQSAVEPAIGLATVLYDPSQATMPDQQGFEFVALSLIGPAQATQSLSDGTTVLDTTAAQQDYAGYGYTRPLQLDRTQGYAVRIAAQLQEESHASENRAGFSLIALSEDALGLELGFWSDSIWAQEGGSGADLFTRAESATFDTTAALTAYEYAVQGDSYTMSARGSPILSGALRDYSAFAGPIDPYEQPNFLFLGDDTTSAGAKVAIGAISVIAEAALPDRTVDLDAELVMDNIGIIYAGADTLTVTISSAAGRLSVPTDVTGGLDVASIRGNESPSLTLTGLAAAINETLTAADGGLSYRGTDPGLDALSMTVRDASGASASGNFSIRVGEILETPTAVQTATPMITSTPVPTAAPTKTPGGTTTMPSQNLYLPYLQR